MSSYLNVTTGECISGTCTLYESFGVNPMIQVILIAGIGVIILGIILLIKQKLSKEVMGE